MLAKFLNWKKEAAKAAGWVLTTVIAGAAVVGELLASTTDLLPEKAKGPVQAAVAIALAVGVGATRWQAILTRNKVISQDTAEKKGLVL